ncbi:hypothetical protein KIN20_003174 [Parelaphostrongylus tenuis]|uniref:Uncharacterized protein n=1 Tax=Parelaphostrongylus tenuis TaxID=148309 RepID=A0AAD5LWA8_PARTN|nr:hypothetical protein KIN20_003174 [Parelaphostrongylus tenuis]
MNALGNALTRPLARDYEENEEDKPRKQEPKKHVTKGSRRNVSCRFTTTTTSTITSTRNIVTLSSPERSPTQNRMH